MKSMSASLSLLLGLSAAAAVAIVVALEHGTPAGTTARAASGPSPPLIDTTPDKQVALMRALARTYLQHKDYTNAIAWARRYIGAGGAESEARPLLVQAHLQLGDYANAARELQWEIQSAERAG